MQKKIQRDLWVVVVVFNIIYFSLPVQKACLNLLGEPGALRSNWQAPIWRLVLIMRTQALVSSSSPRRILRLILCLHRSLRRTPNADLRPHFTVGERRGH